MARASIPTPLISVEELRSVLGDVRLVDARGGKGARERYEEAHIAGALFADLETDLSAVPEQSADGGRHPVPTAHAFADTLGRWDIGPETAVVVYDDRSGILAASRLWWMLRSIGHENVAVLDGGLHAAEAEGLPMTKGDEQVPAGDPYPDPMWRWPVVTMADVEGKRGDDAWRVVDVRAPERYRGETEPLDPVPGHIAGAINLPCKDNLDATKRMRDAEDLRAAFDAALGVPPDRVIVSCGSGVTACHTLLALEQAGLSGAALYVGSWSEWCRRGGENGA